MYSDSLSNIDALTIDSELRTIINAVHLAVVFSYYNIHSFLSLPLRQAEQFKAI